MEIEKLDDVVTFTFANRLKREDFNHGIRMKVIQQKIDEESTLGFAIDLGMLFKFRKEIRVGFSGQNIGPFLVAGGFCKPNGNDHQTTNICARWILLREIIVSGAWLSESENVLQDIPISPDNVTGGKP